MAAANVNIHDVIDREPIGRTQVVALALFALLLLFDGFNIQATSYIVPVLAKEWHLPKSILGSIFSAAFVGLLIGNFCISSLANRFGPKKMAVLSTAAFGLFTLLTTFATNVNELIALRLVTGIGLGAAVPCAIGLTSEFSPKRVRATFVLLIYVGYSFGFTVAGFCSGALIPKYGWGGPLWVGGIGPLVLILFLLPLIPESAPYVARRRGNEDLLSMLKRFYPRMDLPHGTNVTSNDPQTNSIEVKGLFSADLRAGTFLIWAVFVLNLAEFYFLQSWLPTVLTSLSYPPDIIVWATAVSTIGGMVAGIAMGPLMDRIGPYMILSALYLLGGITMFAISAVLGGGSSLLIFTVFCCGFCISGGQKGVVALGSLFYPAGLRATGVAWAYGVGRIGGASGTYVAGVLYAADWSPDAIFRAAAAPAFVASICVAIMGWRYSADRGRVSAPSKAQTER
ncbi:aromatic acid/H+ symport family MFS transporter [Paraburkholderia jirisanensis]